MSLSSARRWWCCKKCDRTSNGKAVGLSRWRRTQLKRETRQIIEDET